MFKHRSRPWRSYEESFRSNLSFHLQVTIKSGTQKIKTQCKIDSSLNQKWKDTQVFLVNHFNCKLLWIVSYGQLSINCDFTPAVFPRPYWSFIWQTVPWPDFHASNRSEWSIFRLKSRPPATLFAENQSMVICSNLIGRQIVMLTGHPVPIFVVWGVTRTENYYHVSRALKSVARA